APIPELTSQQGPKTPVIKSTRIIKYNKKLHKSSDFIHLYYCAITWQHVVSLIFFSRHVN
ncbi:MAG TPA: hypothetical protein PLI62_16270, partial [Spirochaetota bacterium]|nr:hypothetical protein [Spirochaetota bacterium]